MALMTSVIFARSFVSTPASRLPPGSAATVRSTLIQRNEKSVVLVTKNSADSIQDQSAGRDYSGTLRFYPQGAEDEPVSYC
ncbi:hypothetical protein KQS06HV_180121 [Klebsiella quasipneumoniae subsp. similipneumoniae]|nr:hypothetical protein KQS06HV_180121 [Klebsiella quasipneumoniae subsp. similipneumoniae]